MKIIIRTALVLALLIAGFAAGFPIGQSMGFATGSEWALIQADILAREAGLFMPVHYEEGIFRVKLKQPGNIYKRAWQLADRHYEETANGKGGERRLGDNANLTRSAYLMR